MRTLTETLAAGVPVKLTANGSFFFLMEVTAAIDITFQSGPGGSNDECTGLKSGFWCETQVGITQITITSPIAQTIKYACSNLRMGYSRTELQIEQAASIDNVPAVTVGNGAAVALVPGDSSRKGVAFLNDESNTDRIAIGGASVTFANAIHILNPGEPYTDDNAAGSAFYAISETNAGQVVRIEERR